MIGDRLGEKEIWKCCKSCQLKRHAWNGARITGWTQKELNDLDINTRKLMTIYGMFHKKGDVEENKWRARAIKHRGLCPD